MKIEFICSNVLVRMLAKFGCVDLARDGREAVAAFQAAQEAGEPYELITMDVMMPEMSGQQALKEICKLETNSNCTHRAKILMTTAMDDIAIVSAAFRAECDGYLLKPIRIEPLDEKLAEIGIREQED